MSIFFKTAKKILLVTIIVIVLSEVVLRTAISLYYLWYAVIAKPESNIDENAFSIICVGESTTWGHPVHGNGYPEQLEQLLNKNMGRGRSFKVFNLGVSAITSSEIARHFYKNIIDYKPKLAIILAGANNFDHTQIKFLCRKNNSFIYYVADKLYSMKIVKISAFAYNVLKAYFNKTLVIRRLYSDIYIHRLNGRGGEYYQELIEKHNLEYMINIARKHKCRVLICNYFICSANGFLKRFAANHNLSFCDNEKIFKEWTGSTSELISEDGWHPSLKGYSIMAQNMCEAIMKYKLIDQ